MAKCPKKFVGLIEKFDFLERLEFKDRIDKEKIAEFINEHEKCIKEKCEWWYPYANSCSLLRIAIATLGISDNTATIINKL